ncbi:hypothetical protein SDC9_161658 [bioreactor metagenome]|uniref:Uncharacterized protein n=1 Tax=bioreactor metagenome TaxID=1076179 RepID=A0A645FLA0_9ZZZZ
MTTLKVIDLLDPRPKVPLAFIMADNSATASSFVKSVYLQTSFLTFSENDMFLLPILLSFF